MESRFVHIGYERALDVSKNNGIPMTGELVEKCAIHSWKCFIADCSDDYSRTTSEREAADKELQLYISSFR